MTNSLDISDTFRSAYLTQLPPEVASRVTLLGLCGYAGSGKSTLAGLLELAALRSSSYSLISRLSFAAPVKRIARQMGWNGVKDEKGRRLLQLLGTECGRQCIDQDIWVDRWARELCEIVSGAGKNPVFVVVDDVRFVNEAQAIRRSGGLLFRVNRPLVAVSPPSRHVSESLAGLDAFVNGTVSNVGPESQLRAVAEDIVNAILRGDLQGRQTIC